MSNFSGAGPRARGLPSWSKKNLWFRAIVYCAGRLAYSVGILLKTEQKASPCVRFIGAKSVGRRYTRRVDARFTEIMGQIDRYYSRYTHKRL